MKISDIRTLILNELLKSKNLDFILISIDKSDLLVLFVI